MTDQTAAVIDAAVADATVVLRRPWHTPRVIEARATENTENGTACVSDGGGHALSHS